MIIWGWGRVTKSKKGDMFQKRCDYCNQILMWRLCVRRTWFTLFFIPIIPYRTVYCVECPNCGSYMQITKEQYKKILEEIKRKRMVQNDAGE